MSKNFKPKVIVVRPHRITGWIPLGMNPDNDAEITERALLIHDIPMLGDRVQTPNGVNVVSGVVIDGADVGLQFPNGRSWAATNCSPIDPDDG